MSRRRKKGSGLRYSSVEPPKGRDDWRKLRPTPNQLRWIRVLSMKLALPAPRATTRGTAADAIDRLQRLLEANP